MLQRAKKNLSEETTSFRIAFSSTPVNRCKSAWWLETHSQYLMLYLTFEGSKHCKTNAVCSSTTLQILSESSDILGFLMTFLVNVTQLYWEHCLTNIWRGWKENCIQIRADTPPVTYAYWLCLYLTLKPCARLTLCTKYRIFSNLIRTRI